MSGLQFFYADINASLALLNEYKNGEWIHASNGVVCTRLKGGLLDGCNIRFSFIRDFSSGYREEDMDYKNQGLLIFEEDLYFQVLDVYQIGNIAQVLMSPINNIEEYDYESFIRSAREDFNRLRYIPPVPSINNREWKRRVAIVPGVDGKNNPKKGFLTEY